MKVLKLKKYSNYYIVTLSNNTSLNVYEDTILQYNLLPNKEIDNKLLKEISLFNQKYEVYYKALKYLKFKLRTEKEIKEKLLKSNYKLEDIEFSINKLKEQGYLNKDLYIKSFIADQVNLSNKGPRKILYELKKLGFKDEDIHMYLDLFESDVWLDKINKIIIKKEKANHSLSSIVFKNKVKKDLITLGYDITLIEEALSNYDFQDNKIILEKEINKLKRKYQNKYNNDELEKVIKDKLYQKGFNIHDIDIV